MVNQHVIWLVVFTILKYEFVNGKDYAIYYGTIKYMYLGSDKGGELRKGYW